MRTRLDVLIRERCAACDWPVVALGPDRSVFTCSSRLTRSTPRRRGVLRARAASVGRVVVEVDARRISQCCAACGHVARENRPTWAAFVCVRCGHVADADENAAVNPSRPRPG
ncbi:transposase [Frankia gtarii]|uniref:transposase n=1 Tax=Frankia gtarii TaxID=2950102 RepID=UPI0021BE0AFA|nr:transposase [Frankia gtarii]